MIPGLREDGPQGLARARALRQTPLPEPAQAAAVVYASRGRTAVLGAGAESIEAARRLASAGLRCMLIGPHAEGVSVPEAVLVVARPVESVQGWLGDFQIRVAGGVDPAPLWGDPVPRFDLVLDLQPEPCIGAEVPPPGYFATRGRAEALEAALAELPGLVGAFEKPRYFRYDPALCAHGYGDAVGCTRCIEACPAEAIRPQGEKIEVEPHLCQGLGACNAVCPTGALRYGFPELGEVMTYVRRLLRGFRQQGGERPVVLFHDAEEGGEALRAMAGRLDEAVLPVAVEEAGSLGLEAWLATLAYGASAVAVLLPPGAGGRLREALAGQTEVARALLAGLGHEPQRVALVEADEALPQTLTALGDWSELPAAEFAVMGSKRDALRLVLDHLARHGRPAGRFVALPEQAPFGTVVVDAARCTLCMSCTSACPVSALQAGGEVPRLSFVEWNCVQCGLCVATCPEDALGLQPRLDLDTEARTRPRVLLEEAPFHCVVCGKPFATQAVIRNMRERLAGHPMYREPDALRRLEMCGDCRVKDLFASEA
ncbi:MAG TPA: 4Fe-4S dicluster domain-containing protein [Chromatiales bacterium]|nr:4Fe-4S dicluster domain-containing protein [Chromatiales bacterium]